MKLQISIMIDEILYDEICKLASKADRSISYMLNKAVKEYIKMEIKNED